ncbi:MAG: hypothetical protein ACXWRU_19460 [Pseudobdellovibrionaceae bacterium]
MTLKSPSVYETQTVDFKPICVSLDFKYIDRPLGGNKVLAKFPRESDERLKRSLNAFGVQTSCASPMGRFKIYLENDNNINLFSGAWSVLSFLTLGIIPFYHRDRISINIIEDNRVLAEQIYEDQKVVSIFYLFKMHSDDLKAVEKFGANTRADAEFAYVVSEEIRKAIKNRAANGI